jgi:hypothetical protein
VAWVLVWTLRRVQPAGGSGPSQTHASRESEPHLVREPVLVGE